MRVVICGGGVIGACTAYFLSLRQVEVLVVERTGVACAASGKSGGFLALDWCDGSALGRLARRSFNLHAELAATLDGDRWNYRRLETWSVLAGGRRGQPGRPGASVLGWVGGSALVQGKLGTPVTTAQVHPARFTEAMLQAAIDRGAQLRLGRVTGVVLDAARTTALGVEVDGEEVQADAVVIAMGPWSVSACRWLPLPEVHGLKGNSVVYQSDDAVSADALFVEVAAADGTTHTPEVFPRADGTTYVCGLSSQQPLPEDPADVLPDPGAQDALQAMTRTFAPALGDAPDPGDPGLLPAGHAGRPAATRPGPGSRQCLCRHRAQRLGHPQRAGQWRGHGGADRRRSDQPRGLAPVQSRSAACELTARSGRALARTADPACNGLRLTARAPARSAASSPSVAPGRAPQRRAGRRLPESRPGRGRPASARTGTSPVHRCCCRSHGRRRA